MGKALEMAVKMKNFDNSCVVFTVTANALCGVTIKDAVKECIKFAKATEVEVTLRFNGVDMFIRDYHTVDAIVKYYYEEIERTCKS